MRGTRGTRVHSLVGSDTLGSCSLDGGASTAVLARCWDPAGPVTRSALGPRLVSWAAGPEGWAVAMWRTGQLSLRDWRWRTVHWGLLYRPKALQEAGPRQRAQSDAGRTGSTQHAAADRATGSRGREAKASSGKGGRAAVWAGQGLREAAGRHAGFLVARCVVAQQSRAGRAADSMQERGEPAGGRQGCHV